MSCVGPGWCSSPQDGHGAHQESAASVFCLLVAWIRCGGAPGLRAEDLLHALVHVDLVRTQGRGWGYALGHPSPSCHRHRLSMEHPVAPTGSRRYPNPLRRQFSEQTMNCQPGGRPVVVRYSLRRASITPSLKHIQQILVKEVRNNELPISMQRPFYNESYYSTFFSNFHLMAKSNSYIAAALKILKQWYPISYLNSGN